MGSIISPHSITAPYKHLQGCKAYSTFLFLLISVAILCEGRRARTGHPMGKEEKKKKAFHVDSTPLLRLSSGVNPPPIFQLIIAFFRIFAK